MPGLRTRGVNTNGVAEEVMYFDRWGKTVRKVYRCLSILPDWYPKRPSVKKHEVCSDPISADPMLSLSELLAPSRR